MTFSIRSLRRSPGFTAVAVLALALGIAGNTLVFSVINATSLRPLPYPEPQRLAIVRWSDQADLSITAFFMVKNRARSFSLLAAWYPFDAGVNISAAGPPQYVRALSVSRDFFQTLGTPPQIGNSFDAEEDQPGAPHTAVLSYGIWTQMFDRDPSALGKKLWVNGESYRIIGIMPRQFRSYPDVDIWLPLQLGPGSTDPGSNYRVVGRLADGVSPQQAQYDLNGLAREYQSIYPSSPRKGMLAAQPLQAFLIEKEREGLAILFAAVVFVFLIACTNVAILILVRAAASAQAIAIRAAFCPGRLRLVLSLLSESLMLSLVGGLLGFILAKESLPLVRMLWPADLPLAAGLTIDWHVVLFTLILAVLSPLVFGLAPILKLSRVDIAPILARTSRTASFSAESVRAVRLLVFGQLALTVMLLAGTMLLVKNLLHLYSVPLGFNPDHLVVGQISLTSGRYQTTRSTQLLLDQVLKQLEALPGVDAATAVNGLPLDKGLNLTLHPVGTPSSVDHDDEYRPVTYDFFKTFQIPLRAGRFFTPADFTSDTPVAIINETMAHRWWPDEPAIGHYIQVDKELGPQFADVPRQIVGVVADIHEKGPDRLPPTMVFIPISQTPDLTMAFSNKTFLTSIVVRTSGGANLSDQIRYAVQSVDPGLPLASFRPFTQVIDRSLANRRFIALLTTAFSAFALLLAVIGIHGLLNYQARLRTREIAIRIAVGASRAHIFQLVIQQGAKLIFFAVLAGLTGSFIIKIFLANLLYNDESNSVVIILATGLLLGSVAILISFLTAARAAAIEPMAVLRNE
ncbi:MAG: ABC transporter permease [Acidobacteriia bacterium]|nr:ABC transporter permease [Terriglobia bacterium]